MTTTDAGLMPLAMQLSRTRASTIDVPALLGSVCCAVASCVGVGGVALLLAEPLDGCRISASDGRAAWIGDTQLRAEVGPMHGAFRTGRPMLTADLTRIGPPALAAAAAESGLVSSLVVPFGVDGERIGVLQLLGEAHRPVEPADADVVLLLLEVLAVRLADLRDLRRATAPRDEPNAAATSIDDTGVLVPVPREGAPGPASPVEDDVSSLTATTALPVVTAPSHDPTGQPAASSASVTYVPPPPSTAPRPTPRPRPGKHAWFDR